MVYRTDQKELNLTLCPLLKKNYTIWLWFIYLYSTIKTDKSYLQCFTVKQCIYSDIRLQVVEFLKIVFKHVLKILKLVISLSSLGRLFLACADMTLKD